MSTVAVFGLGYVGLPLAVRAAEAGHRVVALDVDARKVASLASSRSYVGDVTDEQLRSVNDAGRFLPTVVDPLREPAHAALALLDVAVIAVPTPLRAGEPDLSYVESAARTIAGFLRPGAAVVLESTTYPGTTEGLMAGILRDGSELEPGTDFHLGFSPERIDPGNTEHTLRNTPKLVSATTPDGLAVIKEFYDSVVDTTVPVSTPRVAETTKLFENIQANVLIALANELATVCHDLDVDVWEVLSASMTKGHSMSYWTPGPGVGGHCLPIDPLYLTWLCRRDLDRPFRFAELADQVNNERPRYVAQRASDLLAARGVAIAGAEVLVLGVAYKPNVGDVRESPAIAVIDALRDHGARVTVVDPYVPDWSTTATIGIEELPSRLPDFALAVVVTDHRDFDYDKIASAATLVLDCRNAMRPAANVVAL